MVNVDIPIHEPKRLIIVRIIIIFIIAVGILVFAAIQIRLAISPAMVYQSRYETGPFMLPAFIIYSASGLTNRESFSLYGVDLSQTSSGKRQSIHTQLELKEITNQTASMFNINYKTLKNQAGNGKVYLFRPDHDLRFASPISEVTSSTFKNIKYYSSIKIKLYLSDIDPTGNRLDSDISFTVGFIKDISVLTKLGTKQKPWDINMLSPDLRSEVMWGKSRELGLRQMNTTENSLSSTHLSMQTTNYQDSVNEASFSIQPLNAPMSDGKEFSIEIQDKRPSFTWFDCFGTVGGALTLSLYGFTFLFGQRRLRPWGIVQRYLFRDYILDRFPRAVVEVTPSYIPPEKPSKRQRRSTSDQATMPNNDTQQPAAQNVYLVNENASSLVSIRVASPIYESPRHSYGMSNRSSMASASEIAQALPTRATNTDDANATMQKQIKYLIRKVHLLEKKLIQRESGASFFSREVENTGTNNRQSMSSFVSNMPPIMEVRVAELEAFRQRAESFFFINDLFWKRGNKTKSKRNTFYASTDYNWSSTQL